MRHLILVLSVLMPFDLVQAADISTVDAVKVETVPASDPARIGGGPLFPPPPQEPVQQIIPEQKPMMNDPAPMVTSENSMQGLPTVQKSSSMPLASVSDQGPAVPVIQVEPVVSPREEKREHYPGGRLKSKAFLRGGKKVGVYKEYWENGSIKMKAEYNDAGVLQGQVKHHNESGVLQSVEFYKNGQKVK